MAQTNLLTAEVSMLMTFGTLGQDYIGWTLSYSRQVAHNLDDPTGPGF